MGKKESELKGSFPQMGSPAVLPTLRVGTHLATLSNLVLELVVEVAFLFLGPDHIHDLPVFREAGGAVSITFRVTLKAVLVERVSTEKVD